MRYISSKVIDKDMGTMLVYLRAGNKKTVSRITVKIDSCGPYKCLRCSYKDQCIGQCLKLETQKRFREKVKEEFGILGRFWATPLNVERLRAARWNEMYKF